MLRLLASVLVVLGLSAPGFAQTTNAGSNAPDLPQGVSDGQPPADGAPDALAQEAPPPPPNLVPLVIGGLAVGGIAAVVVVASQHSSSSTTATSSASP